MGGSKKSTTTQQYFSPEQREMQRMLFEMLKPVLSPDVFSRMTQPYQQPLIAPLSDLEKQAIEMFERYNPTLTPSYTQAKDVLLKTLKGDYLPEAIGSYYEPLKQQVLKEGEEAITKLRQSANLGGMLLSTPRMNLEGKLQADITGKLGTILADIYQQERARQLSAIPQAMALEQLPLDYAKQLLTIGSIPRSIEQAQLEAQYKEYLRQLENALYPIEVASGLAGRPQGVTTTYKEPFNIGSFLMSFLLFPILRNPFGF